MSWFSDLHLVNCMCKVMFSFFISFDTSTSFASLVALSQHAQVYKLKSQAFAPAALTPIQFVFIISCDCFRMTGNSAAHRQKHAILKQSPDTADTYVVEKMYRMGTCS